MVSPSTLKLLQKIKQITAEPNYISRSCQKPKRILSNDQHNCLIDEQHSCSMFLNPYKSWDMVPSALMLLNHTNGKYSLSNQYPQPTTLRSRIDSYPLFSSLRAMHSKKRDCASALHSFNEFIYRKDEWKKQLLRLKGCVISRNPEQWMEFNSEMDCNSV